MKTYPNAKALLSAWPGAKPPRAKPKVLPCGSPASPLQLRNANRPVRPQATAEGSRSSPQNTSSPPASTVGWLGGFSQETISPFVQPAPRPPRRGLRPEAIRPARSAGKGR